VKRCGKSAPREAQATRHGKPRPVQGQIGNSGAARSQLRESATDSGYRLLRQMILSPGASRGRQNSAYSPAKTIIPFRRQNMIIKFDCPGCGHSLDGESELEFQEVSCPVCQQQFFPKPIKAMATKPERPFAVDPPPPSPPAPELAPEVLSPEAALKRRVMRLRGHADTLTFLACACGLIGGIAILIGLIGMEGNSPNAAFFWAAGFMAIASWLFLIGQIMHIRANTEK